MSMDTLTKPAGKPPARTPMTPARWLTLAVGLPVLVALIGWTGLSVVADVGTGTYQFSSALPVTGNGTTLTADLPDADVTLVPGSSGVPGSSARLTGTLTYSLIRPRMTIHGSSVSYRCLVPAGKCSLTSTLSVPRGVNNVSLSSGTGDLTVSDGLDGDMSLQTSSGDLTANGLAGTNAKLKTTAGDITASGITTAADVTVGSVAGAVTVTFAKAPTTINVSSTFGDISIILPPGTTYNVTAHSSIGDVADSVPLDPSSKHKVVVNSDVGDISISTS